MQSVILDTNIWVAAGFKPGSKAGKIVNLVREGKISMVWSEATRKESAFIVGKIPPLDWEKFEDLFRLEDEIKDLRQGDWLMVEDHDDWKFVDAARASKAVIVSND